LITVGPYEVGRLKPAGPSEAPLGAFDRGSQVGGIPTGQLAPCGQSKQRTAAGRPALDLCIDLGQ
jgi:hypothetical protein